MNTRHSRTPRMLVTVALAILAIGLCSGCAMRPVPAYQREHLVDPIMSFKAQAKKDARLTKSFEAREGSTGGNGGEGGGCACN
jgi:Domain of unknown function (DUF4266)